MGQKLREPVKHAVGADTERFANTTNNNAEAQRIAFNRIPFNAPDGVLYTGTLAAGDNVIAHKLGRTPRGWIVTRATGAAATLYETSRDDRNITLNSAGTPAVEVWFF